MDLFWQLFSILCVSGTILFFWNQICLMEYSFYRIIVRMIFYKDYEPVDWLINNLRYIGSLLLFIWHCFSLLELLEQLKLEQVHSKPIISFISSPLNSIGIILASIFMLRYLYYRSHGLNKNIS